MVENLIIQTWRRVGRAGPIKGGLMSPRLLTPPPFLTPNTQKSRQRHGDFHLKL